MTVCPTPWKQSYRSRAEAKREQRQRQMKAGRKEHLYPYLCRADESHFHLTHYTPDEMAKASLRIAEQKGKTMKGKDLLVRVDESLNAYHECCRLGIKPDYPGQLMTLVERELRALRTQLADPPHLRTEAELDAAPDGTVIRNDDIPDDPTIAEKHGGNWYQVGQRQPVATISLYRLLPAHVIYTPGPTP